MTREFVGVRFALALMLAIAVSFSRLAQAADDPAAAEELAKQAYTILQQRCHRCHGGAAEQAGIDVLNLEVLTQERGPIGKTFFLIAPGQPEKSQLLDAVDGGANSFMPQQGSPEAAAMTDAEKELLTKWVASGALFPKLRDFKFLSEARSFAAMRDHLQNISSEDRRYIRFYSFAHLHNNPKVSDIELRLNRAALSKAINSLSKERDVYLPQAVKGTDEAIFAVDLRAIGWDKRDLWSEVASHYPYGLNHDFVKDEAEKQAWKDLRDLTTAKMPVLRGDWFIVTATQPPLYHKILDIPDNLMALEHQLQLNIHENFLAGKVMRSGYAKSGVSKQNRLLERHESPVTPYFWISYDFLPRRGRGDLVRFPLGPPFPGNPYPKQAFDHDGGECIWSLPNGMQAYMLVDGKGGRINQGPLDVVFDREAIMGSPAIVNGISCMYCHREGMITQFRDELRTAEALGGEPREHLLKVYPTHEVMQKKTQQDQDLFLQALTRVIGPFLLTGDDKNKTVSDFPEPVGKVAVMYTRDLTVHEFAAELGFEKAEILQAKIESNRELLRFGLGTMAQKQPGKLKREKWEALDGTSLMQDVASELRLGTPVLPSRN